MFLSVSRASVLTAHGMNVSDVWQISWPVLRSVESRIYLNILELDLEPSEAERASKPKERAEPTPEDREKLDGLTEVQREQREKPCKFVGLLRILKR